MSWITNLFEGMPSTNVSKLNQLYPGAHIKFRRLFMVYAHHAIVTELRDGGKFKIIEFANRSGGFFSKREAKIDEYVLEFKQLTSILLINYEEFDSEKVTPFPRAITVAIARFFSRHNAVRDQYSVLTNNCEHFAFSCKLGFAISFQQLKAINMLLLPFIGPVGVFISTMSTIQLKKKGIAPQLVVTYIENDEFFTIYLKSGPRKVPLADYM